MSVRGQRRLSSQFLQAVAAAVEISPVYALLQEGIYACAAPALAGGATNWSADRLAEQIPGFAKDADPLDASEPYYLTGEHFMRRVYDEDPGLAPLAGAADLLASDTDWAPGYAPEVLARNMVLRRHVRAPRVVARHGGAHGGAPLHHERLPARRKRLLGREGPLPPARPDPRLTPERTPL